MTTNQGTAGQGVGASADAMVERVAELVEIARLLAMTVGAEFELTANTVSIHFTSRDEAVRFFNDLPTEALLAKIGGDA